jgi:hypothetical protein
MTSDEHPHGNPLRKPARDEDYQDLADLKELFWILWDMQLVQSAMRHLYRHSNNNEEWAETLRMQKLIQRMRTRKREDHEQTGNTG